MTTILIKKKDTAGAPAPGDLTNAAGGTEIAVNTATKRIYTKDSGGNVVELGTNASASTIDQLTVTTSTTLSYGTANQVMYLNGSKLLVGSANMTFNGTTLTVAGFSNTGNTVLGDASADTVTVNGTITSNLLFTDGTYDIGASGANRPRDMFLSRNLTVGGTLTLAGGVNLNGNVTIGDASSDTLTINSTITSNLIFTDNTYDIGASGATRPRNLFLGGTLTVGSTTSLAGNMTFATDATYNIGASLANRPSQIYVADFVTIGSTSAANQKYYKVQNSLNVSEFGIFASGKGYASSNGNYDFQIFRNTVSVASFTSSGIQLDQTNSGIYSGSGSSSLTLSAASTLGTSSNGGSICLFPSTDAIFGSDVHFVVGNGGSSKNFRWYYYDGSSFNQKMRLEGTTGNLFIQNTAIYSDNIYTSGRVNVVYAGAANDPYGVISVTVPSTANNYAGFAQTRSGQIVWGWGINTSNEMWLGQVAGGTLVSSTQPLVITQNGPRAVQCIGVGATNPSISGAGITFPATQSPSSNANTLDDYEEGTFDVVLQNNAGTQTVTFSGAGKYTKVGRFISYQINIYNQLVTAIGAGEPLRLVSLPFSVGYYAATGWIGSYPGVPVSIVDGSGTVAPLYVPSNAVDYTFWTRNQWGGASYITMRGQFMAME